MSRKKNLSKFDYAEADKISAVARAKHGDDWGLVRWVDIMREIFQNLKGPPRDIDKLALQAEGGRLIDSLREAIEKKDGSVFTRLAWVVENQAVFLGNGPSADPLRYFLLRYAFDWEGNQKRKFTLRQLALAVEKAKIKTDLRHLGKVCDELGIAREKAKTGRPRKNSGNSSSRKP